MSEKYCAWIQPSPDGSLTVQSCHVYWIGRTKTQAAAALFERIFCTRKPLLMLIPRGLKMFEIDREKVGQFLQWQAEIWATTFEYHDEQYERFLRHEWRTVLEQTGQLGIGLKNDLPR